MYSDNVIMIMILSFSYYYPSCVSAYPSATSVANVSKSTTKRELIGIENIEEECFRMNNLNLILGHSNSIEYCTSMFGLPEPSELIKLIQ